MNKKNLILFPLVAAMLAACGAPAESVSSSSSSEAPSSSSEESSESSVSSEVSSSSESASSEEGPIVKDPVTISMWHTFNDTFTGSLTGFIESFKAVEPNITVNLVKKTGSYDGLLDNVIDGFPANDYPDLFPAYPDSVQMILKAGHGLDLEPYMNNPVYGWSDEDKEDIVPAYLTEGSSYSVDGVYSLPFCKSTEVMYYNPVLLDLNLSAEDETINGGNPLTRDYINNLTWEELFNKLIPALVSYNSKLDADKKILLEDQTYHGVLGYDSDSNWFITLAEQYGYDYTSINPITGEGSLDWNNDGMKNIVKTLNKAYQNGWLQTQGTSGTYTSGPFTKKNLLFCIGSTAGYSNQLGNGFVTEVAKIPHAEGKKARVINQGPSLCTVDHNDDARSLATWLFAKYLLNETNSAAWAINTGYVPFRFSVSDSEDYIEACSVDGKEGKDLLLAKIYQYVPTVGNDLYASPVFTGSATARKQVGALLTAAMKKTTAELTEEVLNELFETSISNTAKDM